MLNDGTFQVNQPEDGYLARFTLTPLDPDDTTGPAAPALVAPADGARLSSTNPDGAAAIVAFDWADATDPSGVRLYELKIGHNPESVHSNETDDGARTLVRSEQSEAQVNMADLRADRVYHWRVRALDNANNFGPWSAARRFNLDTPGGPRLAAAVVTPDGAPGGTTVRGKVLLQGVAPAGGTRVALTSSDPDLLGVPAAVTAPAGASSATFPITTRAVATSTAAWVEAALDDEFSAPVLWIDPPAAAPGPVTLQAESAATRGGAVETRTNHRGFTGNGYLNFVNPAGDFAEFNVNAATAGRYALTFRYANGGDAARAMGLSVNGTARPGGVTFAATGAWSAWREVTVAVQLTAGANRIRLTATGDSGPNLDSLTVVG